MSELLLPRTALPRRVAGQTPESYWQALGWFAASRVVVALLMLLASHAAYRREWLDITDEPIFRRVALTYVLVAVVYMLFIRTFRPHLQLQLLVHVITDLVALALLVYYSGGVRGGLGALMVASVAAGSVLSSRRYAAFFAALATLLLLLESGIGLTEGRGVEAAQFGQAGVIGAACFLTALSVNWLATRLQAQEALAFRRGEDVRNQLAVTQRVIAESQQGVLVVGADGQLRTMNRAAGHILGLADTDWSDDPGRLQLELLLGADWTPLFDRYQHWRQVSRGQAYETELAAPFAPDRPNKATRVRVRFMAALDEDDADSVILVENLQELEQRAQQLKLASMGRLSASIAHEIRNPLGAIRHANGLLAEQLESVPLSRLAGIVEANTVRINRVIEDVLSISRGGLAVDEQVDMERFLSEFLPEFVVQSGAQRHRIAISLETDAPMRFDSNQLRQVLVNLVSNALRYASNDPGAVLITWRKLEDGRLELSVADDGPGLGPDAVAHAFEPFYTTESRGTGLGLYLARELSALNGAGIRYQSIRTGDRYSGAFLIDPRRSDAGKGSMKQALNS